MKEIIGIIAGGLNLSALIVYFAYTLQGKLQPNRAGWAIWTVESVLLFTSYRASGAIDTAWVPLGDLIGIGSVAILSIWYGEGGSDPLERWCLAGTLISIPIWIATQSSLSALLINLFIDFLGVLPMAKKAYLHPQSEPIVPWLLFLAGNSLNLFAVNHLNFSIIIYPIAMTMIVLTVVGAIVWPKKANLTI